MATWTGPTQSGAAFAGRVRQPGTSLAAHMLFRHYGTYTEGRNVYILRDGTVTEQDPSDPSLIAHALWGAHIDHVTDAEKALLIAAGYGAYLSDAVGYQDIYSDVYAL